MRVTVACCLLPAVPCAGKSADPALGYDWAIVTAGAPAHRLLNGKCRTGDALGNYQGESARGFRAILAWGLNVTGR